MSLGRFQNCNQPGMNNFRRHGVEDELGIVGEGGGDQHFFPWSEVVEISASAGLADGADLVSAAFADSEP